MRRIFLRIKQTIISGLKSQDDLVNIINVISSINPDNKITVIAAMTSSQRNSLNIFMDPMNVFSPGYDLPIFDIKFCMYYFPSESAYYIYSIQIKFLITQKERNKKINEKNKRKTALNINSK